MPYIDALPWMIQRVATYALHTTCSLCGGGLWASLPRLEEYCVIYRLELHKKKFSGKMEALGPILYQSDSPCKDYSAEYLVCSLLWWLVGSLADRWPLRMLSHYDDDPHPACEHCLAEALKTIEIAGQSISGFDACPLQQDGEDTTAAFRQCVCLMKAVAVLTRRSHDLGLYICSQSQSISHFESFWHTFHLKRMDQIWKARQGMVSGYKFAQICPKAPKSQPCLAQ